MKIFLDDQMNEPGMPNRQVPEGFIGVRDFDEFKEVFEGALTRGEKIEALDFDKRWYDFIDIQRKKKVSGWMLWVNPKSKV